MTDIELTAAQFVKLGWTLKHNAKCRTYPSDPRKDEEFPTVAVNPNANGYDVGLMVKNGTVEMVADYSFEKSIEQQCGKGMYRILEGYTLDMTIPGIVGQGLSYEVEEVDGELVVTCR